MEYATAIQSDPVGRTRQIVATCRKSGQRREGLQKKPIATGDDTNIWLVQLLRDCETRWSSTFNIIDRLIELHPVSIFFKFKHVINKVTHWVLARRTLSFATLCVRAHISTFQTKGIRSAAPHPSNTRNTT